MSRFNSSFMSVNWRITFILIFFFISSVSVSLVGLWYGCLPAYDLGIFSEIVQEAWRGTWNPFVHTREIYAMQDHWDPIVTLVAWLFFPLKWLISAPKFLLIFETTIVAGSALFARRSLSKRGFSERRAFFVFILILFSPVTWNALRFPVHPTAWALLPSLGFVIWVWDSLQRGKVSVFWGLIWSLLLWTCGEQFAIALAAGLISFLVLGVDRKKLIGLTIFAIGLAWWSWVGRAFYYDGIYRHTHRVKFSLGEVLSAYDFSAKNLGDSFKTSLFLVGPFAFLVAWFKKRSFQFSVENRFLIIVLGFLSPLLLGRLLAASWGMQYGIFCLAGFFALTFLNVPEFKPRTFQIFSFLILATGISGWGKVFHLFWEAAPACSATSGDAPPDFWFARSSELNEIVKTIPSGARVMANFYLIPSIQNIRSDLELHTTGIFHMVNREKPIDFVLMTRDPIGNQWPLDKNQEAQFQQTLLKYSHPEEFSTLKMWRGEFLPEVFDDFSSEQPIMK